MKRILSILSVATLFVLIGCTDSNDDMEIVYDSIIEPDFTVAAAEIVVGVTPVTFTNTTSVEGTTVAEYFWHFGFSGEGNWSEEAEPDPIVYNQAGEYTVTLTAWGADGNRATVKKVVTVLADNVVPTADFSYSPMMVNVGDEVTFTDKSTDSDGEIVSREWVFPDGSTSTETNPSYTFTQKGMFQVKLTVADDRGGESSATKSINVRDGDVSDFTLLWSTEVASADALCDANVVTVSDLGYVYAVTGDGKLVALDAEGAVAWEYDAAAQDKVPDPDSVAAPEHLVGIVHRHVFDLDLAHLPEHLRCIDHRVGHLQVVGIPQRRPAADIEITAVDQESVHMPEGIVALETAVDRLDVAALLDRRLSGPDDDMLQTQVMGLEQRSFAAKFSVFNQFHIFVLRFCYDSLHVLSACRAFAATAAGDAFRRQSPQAGVPAASGAHAVANIRRIAMSHLYELRII